MERPKTVIAVLVFLILSLSSVNVINGKSTRNIWIRTGGPLGGLGYDVRMHPENPDILFVTDAFAGVFKSFDNGQTWTPSNNGIGTMGGASGDAIPVFCLTIDQNNSDIIWSGLQGIRGIYKSTDMGENWTKRDNGVVENEGITFRGFTVDPRSSEIVYAAGEISTMESGREFGKTKGVVYKTTDGGSNWTAIWRGDNLARYIWINPNHPDTLYVSTGIFDREAANSSHLVDIAGGVGIIKSMDGGLTWQQKNTGITNLYVGTLFMHPENPDILLAGSANNAYPEGAGVFLTTNGGDSWIKVLDDGVQSVEISVANPQIAYAGNPEKVYKSTDGGLNWEKASMGERGWGPPGVEAGFPIDFQVDPRDPNRLFANNYGGGNFLSEDGGHSWIVASKGYTGAQVRDIAVDINNPWLAYAAARSGIFASFDGGGNWEGRNFAPAGGLEWNAVEVDPANPGHIIASNNWMGTIFESYDGTETWRNTEVYLPDGKSWRTFAFASSDPQIIYAGTAAFFSAGNYDPKLPGLGIYHSINGGASWEAINDDVSQDAHVTDIAVDPTNPQVVYAATTNKGILKTINGGGAWSVLNNGLPVQSSISSVAINPANIMQIFAGLEGSGLYRSDDGGTNWQLVPAGLAAEANVTCIIFNPIDTQIIYASDFVSGVFRSTDGGQFWQQINQGLRMRSINKLAISTNGQLLYAAIEGEGVYRLNDATGPVSVHSSALLSHEFHLEQNYPNPFNPTTIIAFTLPKNENVKIEIYNTLGRKVATLLNEQMPIGFHEVKFDAKNLPSGIYTYKISAGQFHDRRKMLYLK